MSIERLPLYSVDQARLIDQRAEKVCGLPGPELMARAGAAAFEHIRRQWPSAMDLCVVCGSGNNGGDGLVLARLAKAAGMKVDVYLAGRGPKAGGEAAGALDLWQAEGGGVNQITATLPKADLYVDAVLGIGLKQAPEGEAKKAVEALRRVTPVLSLDVPSGVDADSGYCPGLAVQAQQTITFIVRKTGLYTGQARDCCGDVMFAGLDLPAHLLFTEPPIAWLAQKPPIYPPRSEDTHKGDYGRVLIVGGAPGFAGAARMAGEAALRVGAGLVTVATHPAHAAMLNIGRWELMIHGVSDGKALSALADAATVVAIGPGLSVNEWGCKMWQSILSHSCPLVVDADALNLLAKSPHRRQDWVLTPHPGEAARLLGKSTLAIQMNRQESARRLMERYGGSILLKGAGTLIQTEQDLFVCDAGNPGMASGGMGDILTGVVAGLIAQGRTPYEAALEGACLHAEAGDRAAAEGGERGLLATDLFPWLRRLVNGHYA